ncbi:hypothetical protein Tco_1090690 [Tanacetum coccineum]|uniref:Uncharacterized protein n=1 Tax=Tanacetum coccineum TaxID=301880 RepID=A0ABQ5I6U1_9ASTR
MSKVLQERGSGNLPRSIENSKLLFEPRQVTIPFLSHLYDDCYDEEDGSYELKDLDGYSIGTTLLDDALPTKEKDPGSFTLHYNIGLGELAPTKLIVELADRTVKHPKGIAEYDIKTPLILGRPFLSTTYAKIDMFKRKITLRVRNDKVVFKSDKPTRNIIKRVYVLSLRERMELDLEARLMGKVLILNRSLDPLYGDYIKLNDLNEPLKLGRNQVDDLEPIIEEGDIVNEHVFFDLPNVDVLDGGYLDLTLSSPNVEDMTFELHLLWSCLGLFLFVMALFIHAL